MSTTTLIMIILVVLILLLAMLAIFFAMRLRHTQSRMPSEERAAQGDKTDKKWYQSEDVQLLLFVGGVLGYVLIGVVLWLVLDRYIEPQSSGQKKDLVQALSLIMAGLAGAGGIYFTWRNLSTAREQLKNTQESTREQLHLTREGQITDRFTKAIDQLGKTDDENPPNPIEEIRLGGIYALEQIARDEPDKYHWSVIQVFAAYLRRHAAWQGDPSKVITPAADTQTVLNAIGRRHRYFGKGEDEPLKLTELDFSNYSFPPTAHFEGARFSYTHLENANLRQAQLNKADLYGAYLQGADLTGADLSGADLRGASLEGAFLTRTDLTGTDLRDAHLTATYLQDVTISKETKLDPEGLTEANGVWNLELGEIPLPKWWGGQLGSETPLLEEGSYSIMLWKTLLHFASLSKGWYPSLALPYSLTLSPAGLVSSGSATSFFSGPYVADPHRPKEDYAVQEVRELEGLVAWFENHPYLTRTTEPQEWASASGGASGMQFYVEVTADTREADLYMAPEGPSVPVFVIAPRSTNFVITKRKSNRIIVLEGEDEWIVNLTEGPPNNAFNTFRERVDQDVLANLYWGKKAHELLEVN